MSFVKRRKDDLCRHRWCLIERCEGVVVDDVRWLLLLLLSLLMTGKEVESGEKAGASVINNSDF